MEAESSAHVPGSPVAVDTSPEYVLSTQLVGTVAGPQLIVTWPMAASPVIAARCGASVKCDIQKNAKRMLLMCPDLYPLHQQSG